MSKIHQISRKELIANQTGLCMFDLDSAKSIAIDCTEDLTIESLCHSDGQINDDGHNLLVKVNNAEYKDAYMLMSYIDYSDFVEDFYGDPRWK